MSIYIEYANMIYACPAMVNHKKRDARGLWELPIDLRAREAPLLRARGSKGRQDV